MLSQRAYHELSRSAFKLAVIIFRYSSLLSATFHVTLLTILMLRCWLPYAYVYTLLMVCRWLFDVYVNTLLMVRCWLSYVYVDTLLMGTLLAFLCLC